MVMMQRARAMHDGDDAARAHDHHDERRLLVCIMHPHASSCMHHLPVYDIALSASSLPFVPRIRLPLIATILIFAQLVFWTFANCVARSSMK